MKESNLLRKKALASLALLLLSPLAIGCSSSNNTPAPNPNTEDDEEPQSQISQDTPEMELLQSATSAYDKGLLSLSRDSWAALRDGYPGSAFLPLAELKIADSYLYGASYPEAITSYEEFIRLHPGHKAVPYARYQIGNAYFDQYSDKKRDQAPLKSAIEAYTKLVSQFPTCDYAESAKRQIERSRELLAEYEAEVARFYLEQGLTGSAVNRYNALLDNYGDTKAARNLAPDIYSALNSTSDSEQDNLRKPDRIIVEPATHLPTVPEIVGGVTKTPQVDDHDGVRASLNESAANERISPTNEP